MVNVCIFVEYTCVQNLAAKVLLVIEILEKQHRGHFYGHPVCLSSVLSHMLMCCTCVMWYHLYGLLFFVRSFLVHVHQVLFQFYACIFFTFWCFFAEFYSNSQLVELRWQLPIKWSTFFLQLSARLLTNCPLRTKGATRCHVTFSDAESGEKKFLRDILLDCRRWNESVWWTTTRWPQGCAQRVIYHTSTRRVLERRFGLDRT